MDVVVKMKFIIDYDSLLNQRIDEVFVGAPSNIVTKIFGVPDMPIYKINKKSKIFSHVYGNLNILSENGKIIAILIDFHTGSTNVIELDKSINAGFEHWLSFAKKNGYDVEKNDDMVKILGTGIAICLSCNGVVTMISFH